MSPVESTPAIGISVQCQVGDARQIVFQCFVPMDCESEALHAALDKVVLAAERQEARVRLPKAREHLLRLERAHRRAVEDMARLDAERAAASELRREQNMSSGRRGDAKPSAQQLAHDQKAMADRANAEISMQRSASDITELQAEIAELEQKVA